MAVMLNTPDLAANQQNIQMAIGSQTSAACEGFRNYARYLANERAPSRVNFLETLENRNCNLISNHGNLTLSYYFL